MARGSGAKRKIVALRQLPLHLQPFTFSKELDADDSDLMDVDFDIQKADQSEDGSIHIEGVLNTSDVDDDLDGDVVDPRAFEADIKHFNRHPVIRREHKHPIGRVLKVEFRPEGPWFEGVITHDAPGEQTRDMIAKKVLRGISARFKAQPKVDHVELLPKGQGRLRIKRARLVEVTVTDVPRNSGGHFRIKEPTRLAFQKSLGAGSGKGQEDRTVKFNELIARLLSDAGFKCLADDDLSIMKALGDAIAAGKGAASLTLIAKALGQSESSTADQLIDAIKTAQNKDGMVAKSLFDDATKKSTELEVELLLLKSADKITPANRDFAKSLATTNRAMFDTWLSSLPAVPTQKLPGGGEDKDKGEGEVKLTPEDLSLMKSFGVINDEKELKKLVGMKPHEIMSQIFKQGVSETAYDKAYRALHTQQWEAVS